MNKEIKEILDRLDYNEWEVDLYKVPITWCELYDIRDYITNLQQDTEMYAQLKDEYEEEIKDLQQENERLKEQVNENKIIVEYAIKPSFTTRKLEDYKSRCEKAIEYIKSIDEDTLNSMFLDESYISNYGAIDLLNILQNGDNNEVYK